MDLFLLIGSILGATIEVILFLLGAVVLTSLIWYFGSHLNDRTTIDTLKKSLDKVKPEFDVLQNQHEHLKSEHAKVKQGLADLMENHQLLTTKHKDYIANESSKKNVYEQVDEERQSLLDSYESLENNYAKYNDAETTLDRLEEELENIKEEKSELLSANEQLKKEIHKLQNSANSTNKIAQLEIPAFDAGSTDEDDEIEKLIGAAKGKSFAGGTNTLAFVPETTQTETSDKALHAELDGLKADYHLLEVEHQTLHKQFESLKNTHDELIEANQSLKKLKKNDTSKDELIKLKDEHSSLQDDYVTLRIELNNKVLPQLRATQSLLNKKEEKYRLLVEQMEKQSAKIQNSSNQLKSFEGVRATLAEKNTELERKYEKLSGEYTGLHSQFRILRDQFGFVESKLETSESTLNSAELEELSNEYSNLKLKYLSVSDQFKTQQARVKNLESLLHSINESSKNLESLLHSINESSSYGIIYLPSNLQVIEGIGPKIEPVLNKAGIQNWVDLARTELSTLKAILKDAGRQFDLTDPSSWNEQAQLLANGEWKAFRDFEASLIAGRKIKSKDKVFDDLKVIEGIGPKMEVLLNNSNIYTWKKLSKTGTWPEQAGLASSWSWTELEMLQEELKGGRAQL